MCDINWIELARICINEGICGLNWNLLDTDWFELAWNRLDRLGLWIGLVLLKRGRDCRRRACDAAHRRHQGMFRWHTVTLYTLECNFIYIHNESMTLPAVTFTKLPNAQKL
jgi:hypothetical protein